MVPANQRLDPMHRVVAIVDQRLVIEFEFVVVEGRLELFGRGKSARVLPCQGPS